MAQQAERSSEQVVLFAVNGITCLDCAAKFEQAVKKLPGVHNASLNVMAGKLTIEGVVDLELLRQLGRAEHYSITPMKRQDKMYVSKATFQMDFYRALGSVLALFIAYGLEKNSFLPQIFIACYALATVIGGWKNFINAAHSLARGRFNMSVLMSVAVFGAFAIRQYEEGAVVAFLFSISEILEAWTLEKARHSIQQLMDIVPKVARVRRGTEEIEVVVEEIHIGDVMMIYPGEKIAMDGVVLSGQSAVNQASVTGESLPIDKAEGNEVYASTFNTYGFLEVKVTRLVQDSTISRMIQLVEEAQQNKAPLQNFVERFAAFYTPAVFVLAVGIMVIPPLFFYYAWAEWIYRGLALLVVACPCALVISTPVAIVSAISNAARQGVLIKGGIYLEQMGSLGAIAFDKTGTLTKGQPIVTDVLPFLDDSKEELLSLAASLEAKSEHPLGAAIVKSARQQGCFISKVETFSALAGRGIEGVIQGETVYIGNQQFFRELNISIEPCLRLIEDLQVAGKTAMIMATKQHLLGILAVADEVRETAALAVAELKGAGISHTIMLTGDNVSVAQSIAAQIGLDEFRSELLPEDKAAAMKDFLECYGKVAMIGDGVNDAPSLAVATVGIAMGGAGTDTALETADIVLMNDDLLKLPFAIQLSRKTLAIIRQNIGFALGVKLLAVLAVFPGWLTLWLAIMADMGATLIVTLNSMRLLKVKG
jgi:Zn2+/Cd2+-exporting ATPase